MIPIHFENDDKAKLLSSDGEGLIIEAHLDKVANAKYWFDDASYGLCHRNDITLTELIKLLPEISEYLKCNIEVKEDWSQVQMGEVHKIDVEAMPCITYRVLINNKCVFKKDTIHNGSVLGLREEVLSWIARFIYDYEILSFRQ